MEYEARELTRGARVTKRSFDVLFSLLFLLTVFPVVFIILFPALAIGDRRRKGSLFFTQPRTGYRGRTFICIKFRTMRLSQNAHLTQAVRGDERVTRIGRFLRATSIDEFPQFINVLRGDMSVVGPRPHMLRHTAKYSAAIPYYNERHKVRPGVTGYAQMRGFTGPTPEIKDMERRVQADVEYINMQSFWLDCRLVMQTILKAAGGKLHESLSCVASHAGEVKSRGHGFRLTGLGRAGSGLGSWAWVWVWAAGAKCKRGRTGRVGGAR
ncbi:MAG: sugar transferase [Rikenellaceae bacterium]|jgi:putative colanic acid biosynthesis UDP-glucose lipid carrier transferase|nr:sugar transferase [Rikenellaceae bacterium]